MREHVLMTIAEHRVFNAEQYADAEGVCSCEPDDLISRVAGLVASIDALRTRLAETEAVLSKLPKTKDGVHVTLGMSLWLVHGERTTPGGEVLDIHESTDQFDSDGTYAYFECSPSPCGRADCGCVVARVSDCYSTSEAARGTV